MPKRQLVFVNESIYHVFNRSIGKEPIFINKRENQRALALLDYYRYPQTIKFSTFTSLSRDDQAEYLLRLARTSMPLVKIYCFVLMPNHFHLIVKQKVDKGISRFLANFQNSFAKYFNKKNERTGSLFQNMFKAILVEDDKQLVHLSRYIHLNPATSFIVETERLIEYPWSSFPVYLGKANLDWVVTDLINGFFKSAKEYESFVYDQADYQKRLHFIKHLSLENT